MAYLPSAAEIDGMIWAQGFCRWLLAPISPRSKRPHELDYLRGIHNEPTLTVLGRWLSAKTGKNVRLRSMWQDKHVYVQPVGATGRSLERRELADLAVIVQRMSTAGIERSMWLLQAKVCANPMSAFTGGSSKREIELMEKTDRFWLLDGMNRPVGKSYDARGFVGPRNWSFLTIHKHHNRPMSASDPYPLRQRWPGSVLRLVPATQSFSESLAKACNGTFGASVDGDPRHDEWSRLYFALMDDAQARRTVGYAKTSGNPTGSVMQLAAVALPGFLNWAESQPWNSSELRTAHLRLFDRVAGRGFPRITSSLFPSGATNGGWGGEIVPTGPDGLLLNEAFGTPPPGDSDPGLVHEGGGEGSGVPHIVFADIWSSPDDDRS